ncbi:MAG: PH domain-containing protein [Phycisphaerae bacterium]|nr:PH domain-containing protein [Phycisphaerae bacterium]
MNQQTFETPRQPRSVFALAEMSTGMSVLTWSMCVLGLALPIVIFIAAPEVWMSMLLAGVIWGTYAFVWVFYRPSRFEICRSGLRIVWPMRSFYIPAAEIAEIAPISKSALGLVLRTFGAGGLWGGFGRFWSRKMGHMLIYASRSDGLVCIRRGRERTVLISPARPDEFITELQRVCSAGGES